MRGSPIAYQQLKEANQLNDDTLYFIYREDALDGELYLGSKLIAGAEGLASLNDIEINVESLKDKQVLAYDAGSDKWVNATIEEAVNTIFVGATANSSGVAGLVPAPDLGQTNLFLRSDGTWTDIKINDEPSINLTSEYPIVISENGVITLQIDNAILDIVNNSLTIIGYEAAEDGAVLTKTDSGPKWTVPDNSAIENLETIVETMSTEVNELKGSVEQAQQNILAINENISSVEDDVLKLDQTSTQLSEDVLKINGQIANLATNKANISDVYTKTETLEQIESAIAAVDHLKRTIVSSTETIDVDLPNADEYIYMIPNAKGTYDEYMVIDGELEKVGDWETDLTGYVTKTDLESVNGTINNLTAVINTKVDQVYSNIPTIDPDSASTTITAEEFAGGEYFIKASTGGYVKADTYVEGTTYYTQKKDEVSGDPIFTSVPHTLLTPDDRAKLDKLVFDDDGGISVSGNINISQVQGLDGYLTETHFTPSVVAKLNYITSVDNNFVVDNGELKLNSTVGRLLTVDEADKIVKAANGEYNFIRSVNQGEFKVTNGNLSLGDVPVASLTTALGDLNSLENDVVTSIKDINTILTWGEIAEIISF